MALKEKMLALADQIRVMFSAEETESAPNILADAAETKSDVKTGVELADESAAGGTPAADAPDEANSETKAVEELNARVDELAGQVQTLTGALAAMQGERDAAQADALALRTELSKMEQEPADTKVNLSASKPASKTLSQLRAEAALARKNA